MCLRLRLVEGEGGRNYPVRKAGSAEELEL